MAKPKYVVFSNDVAPVHPGVYQREFSNMRGQNKWMWAVYTNKGWRCAWNTLTDAKYDQTFSGYQTGDRSPYSSLRWRGLAEKPE